MADYTHEDITDRMAPGWPNSAKVHYWHEESPTHTGKAWAVEFPVSDSHFRFTTRLGRDNNTTADNRLARLNEMAEKLKEEGRNPIVAINGNFFTYPQDKDEETGKYLPINLYGSIMSDSRMLTGLSGTLLTESASHEFEFSTSRISSRGWPCDSQMRKIRNATGFYEPDANSLKIKFERDNGGYKNLDSDRNYPRSLIGLRNDVVNRRQYLYFFVSDGRQPTWSGGVEDRDAVGMLVTLGCQTVAENDGGGSAGMWIKDLPVELQPRSGEVHSGFISRPDGGSPRTVAEGIFMTYEQGPFDGVELRSALLAPSDPYDTLEEAFRAVSKNDYAMICKSITVKHSCTNAQPCTLRAVQSAARQTVTVAEGAELFLKNALIEDIRILAADGSGGTVKVPARGNLTVGARVYDLRVESADDNGFCMGTNMTESIVVDCRTVTEENQSFGQVAAGISAERLDEMLPLLKHPTDPRMIAVVYEGLNGRGLRWARPTVRVGKRAYESLDDALEAAKGLDKALVEVFAPSKLTKSYVISANCTIMSTNENARVTPVEFASGAKLTVGAGARVLFTNVVFTAGQGVAEVEVEAKGVAAVAGLADVGTLRLLEDPRSTSSNPPKGEFELAGPLTDDVRVDVRVKGASSAAIGDFVGVSSLTLEEAKASAGHVVNAADDELAGEAYEDGGAVKIRWAVAVVSDGNAAARFISEDGAVTNNYKSLKMLFRGLKDSGQIELLEDCLLVEPATIPSGKSVVLFAAGEDPAVVKLPASNTWKTNAVISVCGTLSVTNVVFDGREMPSGGSSLSVFRIYGGASLELGAGAGVQKVKLGSSVKGVAYVLGGGVFRMGDGSFLAECSGGTSGGGAAVYLSQKNAALDLFGGRIVGCTYPNGAAYASAAEARIAVRGGVIVTGNKTTSGTTCNVKLSAASCLTLAGELTGTVGVTYGNADGTAFGVVSSGGDSADHFICDVKTTKGETLLGSASNGTLVWKATVIVPPPNVEVDGKTYGTLADAVAAARAGDTLTILAPIAVSSMPVRIDKKLTITASDPANVISRGTNGPMRVSSVARAIEVAVPGVVFKNVVLGDDDCAWPRAFVHVLAGGELTLGEGAVIRNVRAKSMMREGRFEPIGRSAAGVLVEGTLVMEDGATICNCTNVFSESMGGGVLASGPSAVFDFRGGTVTRCSAAAGGGVAVEKHATALVRDDGVILGNANGNLYVAAESPLEIADVFTGRIDYHEGVTRPDTETNIFADVTYDFAGDLEALAAGAIRFTNELTRACGVAVTNETGEAACYVWNTALADGPTYEKDGVRWTAVGEVPPQPSPDPGPVPPPEPPKWEVVTNHPTPIAFRSIDRVSDTEWTLVVTNRVEYCNYRLIWTKDLTKGFTSTGDWEHAVGEAAAPIWTTNVITTGGAWFWRAEGADGTNMVLKTEE